MQIIIFDLQGKQYAIKTDKVEEISKPISITHVPNAPKYIKGLINLRGNVISLVEISELIGSSSIEEDYQNIIIVNTDGEMVGILVGEVWEVMNIEEKMVEKEGIKEDMQKGIKGIIQVQDRIINLLELEGLLV